MYEHLPAPGQVYKTTKHDKNKYNIKTLFNTVIQRQYKYRLHHSLTRYKTFNECDHLEEILHDKYNVYANDVPRVIEPPKQKIKKTKNARLEKYNLQYIHTETRTPPRSRYFSKYLYRTTRSIMLRILPYRRTEYALQ